LDTLGIPYQDGVSETGVIAIIEGGKPGPMIAIRAELDALPIPERTGLHYSSRNNGVMHACGHDIHMANLIGVAMVINELRGEMEGSVMLVFQPGEELLPGGALDIIQSEVFNDNKPDMMIGLHVLPELEAGKVGFRAGPYMASGDELYFRVKGIGGHAALRSTLIDPIIIASQIVIALQKIADRGNANGIPTVLSIGKFIAEGATNVIPDEVLLEGTFRTMNEPWRNEVHLEIQSIAQQIASSIGGQCEVEIVGGYPSVLNNELLTTKAVNLSKLFLGEQNVVDLPIRMTTDDFAYYSQIMPSVYFRVGVGFNDQAPFRLHSSTFVANTDALCQSIGLTSWLAINLLAHQKG
jgi:amidohydrolase